MTTNSVYDVLSNLMKSKSSTFASIVYTNAHKETSKYFLHLNCNLHRVYQSDLKKLQSHVASTEIEEKARQEIMKSIQKSLDSNFRNDDYTKLDYYSKLSEESKSVYYHENELYLRNVFVITKNVLIPSDEVRKEVKSRELTIAKRKLEKKLNLKRSRIREFKINTDDIHEIKMNKTTLIIN